MTCQKCTCGGDALLTLIYICDISKGGAAGDCLFDLESAPVMGIAGMTTPAHSSSMKQMLVHRLTDMLIPDSCSSLRLAHHSNNEAMRSCLPYLMSASLLPNSHHSSTQSQQKADAHQHTHGHIDALTHPVV